MPLFSKTSLDKLATCDQRLQAVFAQVIKHVDCIVLEGHRGKAAQDAAVLAGNSKTPWPTSKHNSQPSKAIDIAPYPLDWNDHKRFHVFIGFVLATALSMGIKLRSGADWDRDWTFNKRMGKKALNDLPHFEIVE